MYNITTLFICTILPFLAHWNVYYWILILVVARPPAIKTGTKNTVKNLNFLEVFFLIMVPRTLLILNLFTFMSKNSIHWLMSHIALGIFSLNIIILHNNAAREANKSDKKFADAWDFLPAFGYLILQEESGWGRQQMHHLWLMGLLSVNFWHILEQCWQWSRYYIPLSYSFSMEYISSLVDKIELKSQIFKIGK